MCTRFHLDSSSEEVRKLISEAAGSPLADAFRKADGGHLIDPGDVGPSDIAPVISAVKSRRSVRVFPMRWGFRVQMPRKRGNGSTSRTILNARAESASEKSMFSVSWADRRCVIPASWYYEWKHASDSVSGHSEAYSFRSDNSNLLWMCGLYRIENGLPEFVILTRKAVPGPDSIHDRMPLMLRESDTEEWILSANDPKGLLSRSFSDVIFERSSFSSSTADAVPHE
ncbi:MAG: SOS response-associated peptidase family protein [Clostridia bacterium]|nr:SOS response-associated peptidase family protein [Clostridia bacterium]